MADAARKPGLVAPLLATACAVALTADQVRLSWLAGKVEVSHLLSRPPLWLWAPLLLAALACGAVGLYGARARADEKLARVPLLALVIVVFVSVFVTGPVRPADPQLDSVALVQSFASIADQTAEELGHVPATAEELEPVLAELAPPPYLLRGEPIPHWHLLVRTGCSGPDTQAAGVAPGSFVYCLAADGKKAWVTAVGRSSTTFGAPEVLTLAGQPISETVQLAP